jgi:predicted RNA binding protein YcfA (HicA-like mRNA interferase family)
MKPKELLTRCARGDVRNVSFVDLQSLVEALGFELKRVGGSHHIYAHPAVPQLVNLQREGNQAKPYQIRQLLTLIEQYSIDLEDSEQ